MRVLGMAKRSIIHKFLHSVQYMIFCRYSNDILYKSDIGTQFYSTIFLANFRIVEQCIIWYAIFYLYAMNGRV